MELIKLFAPNELEIVGVLAEDKSLRDFDYSYDRSTKTSFYQLRSGQPLPSGTAMLVDSSGKVWNSTDVEWHTLFKRR
jgi:hypothetical protein